MDQNQANDWANDSTQAQTVVDPAAPTSPGSGRKLNRSVILGVAAACLLSGGIGYGIGSVSHGNNYPDGGFAQFDGRPAGPGGQLPSGPDQPNGGQLPGDGDGDGFGHHGFDPDGDHQPPDGQTGSQGGQTLGNGTQQKS